MWGQKNWSHMRASMCSRPRWPTWLWYPYKATSLYVVGNPNWKRVSSDSLGLAHLYRMPCLSTRLFCSYRNRLNLGGLVNLDCHHSRVPSQSLEMTRLRAGSTCRPWHQCSKVIQVTCWLSWTVSRMCRLQLGLNGICRVFEVSLLHSLHCCSCDCEMNTWVVRHASWPGHPQQSICICVCLTSSEEQLEIVVCQAGNPAMTCCIHLGSCEDVSQGIVVCIHIKVNPYKYLWNFSTNPHLRVKNSSLFAG